MRTEERQMNPYESPDLNADHARYDRSLFWRVVKCSLWILGVLVVVDIGCWVLIPSVLGSQGSEDAISFLAGHNGWLHEQIERVRDFMR
jgi:uncharacterized membrane protein